MPPVRLDRTGDAAELVLDAPPLNLFDDATLAGLEAALGELERARPRALLVRAPASSSGRPAGSPRGWQRGRRSHTPRPRRSCARRSTTARAAPTPAPRI